MTLTRYSDFAPSGFDASGLGCPDQQDWLVAPCARNRDSELLTESNFAVQLADFEATDPDGTDFEVHRFGHWGNGWFEIVLVRPDSPCAILAQRLSDAISHYPVLDDGDYSDRKAQALERAWNDFSTIGARRKCLELIAGGRYAKFACRKDFPYDIDVQCALEEYFS